MKFIEKTWQVELQVLIINKTEFLHLPYLSFYDPSQNGTPAHLGHKY
jgi:hypothetical protein